MNFIVLEKDRSYEFCTCNEKGLCFSKSHSLGSRGGGAQLRGHRGSSHLYLPGDAESAARAQPWQKRLLLHLGIPEDGEPSAVYWDPPFFFLQIMTRLIQKMQARKNTGSGLFP